MSKSLLWKSAVFIVFAFAALIIFFWVRDGSLQQAGASMDHLLGRTGHDITQGAGEVVNATGNAINRATDGDKGT